MLMQAQGAERRDEAALEQARIDLQRYQTLLSQNSIAKQQVDTQAALVKQLEGTVMLDKGAVAAAQVNVNYTRILSPVDGRVGVRLVDAGNLVSTQDTQGIITINEVSPIAVTFTVPQGDFQRLASAVRRLLPAAGHPGPQPGDRSACSAPANWWSPTIGSIPPPAPCN